MTIRKQTLTAFAILVLLAVALIAGKASADPGGNDNPTGKKVPLCHATGSATNPYVDHTGNNAIPLNQFLGQNGHQQHEGDIWAEFTYTLNNETHTIPAQGDQSILANGCDVPHNEKVAKPEATFDDPCGTKNDVFSVAPGTGYTVGARQVNANDQSITVTLLDNFEWADGSKNPLIFTKPLFTDVACGLPDTGGAATYATGTGVLALIGAVGVGLLLIRRRTV